jgi:hypothetical protein
VGEAVGERFGDVSVRWVCWLAWQYRCGTGGVYKGLVGKVGLAVKRNGCYRLGWYGLAGRKFALVWRGLVRFGHIR